MDVEAAHSQQAPTADGPIHAVGTNNPAAARPQGVHPWYSFWGLLGFGRRGTIGRRAVVTLCFKLLLGLGQIVAIAITSSISVRTQSPTRPPMNEWDACDRPLAIWNILWAIRVGLGCMIATYTWWLVRPGMIEFTFDPEHNLNTDAVQGNNPPPPIGPLNGPGQPQHLHAGRVKPTPRILQLLTSFLSFLSLVWFIVAHVLVYSSLSTCRLSSPHVWYMTFSVLCMAYVLLIEVLVVIFFLFFLVPILFLLVNVLLLCLGRQPLFRPNGINHEIGKLPQAIVDRIPLVFYIPTPPPKDVKEPKENGTGSDHTYPPVTVPEIVLPTEPAPVHTKDAETSAPRRKHRFFFLKKSKKGDDDLESGKKRTAKRQATEDDWESNWERGDYPFVKLPNNRATCAICLLDFEEPPRRGASTTNLQKPDEHAKHKPTAADSQVPIEDSLSLQDAGEGATPLRLLACGHAFHKTCLDPWLKDVSGRCPVCQKPVDIEELDKLSKKGSTAAWASTMATPSERPKSSVTDVAVASDHSNVGTSTSPQS